MNLPIGTSSAFFLDLYARYQRDPYSVPADWRVHFEDLNGNDRSTDELASRLVGERRRAGAWGAPSPGGLPGRNDPCPCGSNKKYKKCHGAKMEN